MIYKNWAKAGGAIALFILVRVFLLQNQGGSHLHILCWLNLAFLMLHQFEEYVFPGGFKDFFNKNIYGKNPIIRNELNDKGAFYINVTLAWSTYLIAALSADPLFLAVLASVNLTNGFLHSILAIVHKKYNPGFATGFFLFIPFSVYIFSLLVKENVVSGNDWIGIAATTIIGSLSIPFILYLTGKSNES